MKSWLSQKGCQQKLMETEASKFEFSEKGVSSVVTYHPLFKSIGKIIYYNLYLLYRNEEPKRTFTPGPMVYFRSSRK